MGKLEERVYSNFFNNAVLRVTSESAGFYYYGLNVKAKETYSVQNIGLENFFYLKSFLEMENHYMEMSYDEKKQLYSAVLCCSKIKKGNKKSNAFVSKKSFYEKQGLDFLSIFEALEECLMVEKYRNIDKEIQKQLYAGWRFQICGSPKVNGVYICEESQVKCISEKEFVIEEYLKNEACYSLHNAVLSGKILELRYVEEQFVLELCYLYRNVHQGPFTKIVERFVSGENISTCFKEMESQLNEKLCLTRKKISQ